MLTKTDKALKRIPIHRNIVSGDTTIVGYVELDLSLLPPDPYYSLTFIPKKSLEYSYVLEAASLVDDYDLAIALSQLYAPGAELIKRLRAQR